MSVHNEEIARMFDEMAELLSLQNENPFRIRAYQRAALSIRGQRRELGDLVRQGTDAGEEPNAALDALPDDLLSELDVVVASIHSHFDLTEQSPYKGKLPQRLSLHHPHNYVGWAESSKPNDYVQGRTVLPLEAGFAQGCAYVAGGQDGRSDCRSGFQHGKVGLRRLSPTYRSFLVARS